MAFKKHAREKILHPQKYPREKIWTHEISTRKNFGPRNTHEKSYGPTKARWHDATKPTRPTMAGDPRNLPHSLG